MKALWPKTFLEWRDGDALNISVPFTWELPSVVARINQMTFDQPKKIRVGGPAVRLMPNYLDGLPCEVGGDLPGVLQRFNPLATRTTTGCPNSCSFCAVPKTEGGFQPLDDWPDQPILCDNNLLYCSQSHWDRVCDRLEKHGWADFNQGLDARLLLEHHAERIKRIGRVTARLALDNTATKPQWENAYGLLRCAGIAKAHIASYVLVGFHSGPDECWARCEWVEKHGTKAYPMWFHPLDAMEKNTVTARQRDFGWNDYERRRIMRWYYKHTREPLVCRAVIAAHEAQSGGKP